MSSDTLALTKKLYASNQTLNVEMTLYLSLGTLSKKNHGIIWEFFPNALQNEFGTQKILGQFTKVLGIGKTPAPYMGKIPK